MKHLILFSANNFLLLCALNRAKNGDIVKLDFNVLYIRYLSLVAMESDHSCLYSVISLFLNSLRNVFSSPTPWFSHTWLKPYLYKRERERENSNSKTLILKDSREKETETETDRQTERETRRET